MDMASQVVAFRLRPEFWHEEGKLSQDKPDDEQARVLGGLEQPAELFPDPAGAWTRRIDEKYGHARGAAGAQGRVVIRLMPERARGGSERLIDSQEARARIRSLGKAAVGSVAGPPVGAIRDRQANPRKSAWRNATA